MVTAMERSGNCDCRYHIVLKSPAVHPMRHLVVLTAARCHTSLSFQKDSSVKLGGVTFAELQDVLSDVVLVDDLEHARRLNATPCQAAWVAEHCGRETSLN